jgi:hypothetical protein
MRGVAVLVIGVGAVLNFAGGIGPLSDDRNDYWAAVMAHVSEAVPPGALVISECSWLCRQYAERAGPEHVYPSAGPEGRVMAEIAAGRNTGEVYLTEWAIAPPNLFLPAGEGRRAAFLSEIEEMLGPLPGAAATPMRAPAVWLWDGGWRMVAPGRDLAPGR